MTAFIPAARSTAGRMARAPWPVNKPAAKSLASLMLVGFGGCCWYCSDVDVDVMQTLLDQMMGIGNPSKPTVRVIYIAD